ncbi:CDP-alcohol phosphatidyltransferase family protein [Rathayibacter iranicus]|uniref:CDP-alcohol phosphatidyltransferase family protein n=2 Tax=Rathayibacter iranicus TaxID=59737 RepID=A0AAD1AER4_9MICO|nr:CDP-alcohol phosphatidyltransferase family protein [Rathayibacter iranicus]AZZ54836.1 CDP-alcohol phosphatidyltransferase family protein [Rathayibacter iranicus]MWV31404.1 CDP-alcohol phosphatidyltransferase family protein [Rathayibacter iranicus NCPPB 2253 = VKM Ac-1602]PPI50361.1 CDP-diacylglycerol--glycerol-3-phosphate 3-phosphatidyltransferase [Rathayibacter iranicus]PPI62755.1 CDP-diacylglycerol--glycerol-3-phosphate 3-phosphatidyltransferase [Rathayibacter iranicus]PPI73720.1 CDP-diac
MRRAGEDRIWTVPNILSLVRLALVPVFLVLVVVGQDALALLVLVVSSLTDYLDGWIARRFDQMTRLGRILDPAADRLSIFATVLGLAARDLVPWWLVAVLLARDLMLVVLAVILANHGYGPLPVHHLGKFATFCLLYALPLIMLGQAFPALAPASLPLAWAFALWGVFLYWWAGIVYAVQTCGLVLQVRTGDQGSGEGHDSDTLGR